MKISDWARQQHIHPRTAQRWFEAGNLPVPARRLASGTILVEGTVIEGPQALRRGLRKLRGSRNRSRAARRLARHHARVAHLRLDHLHKLTTTLAKTHGRLVVEDLNVKGMLGRRNLARSLSDSGFGGFRRQLAYKCEWYGFELVVADRWFPSSKRCSAGGVVKTQLCLNQRTYRCESCGLVLDRDLNAAINLAGWAHPAVTASAAETLTAGGADRKPGTSPAGGCEAGIGLAPESTGSIGGPQTHVAFVTV